MIAKLYDKQGNLIEEINIYKDPNDSRPDVVVTTSPAARMERIYVADPFTIRSKDSWWRYSEAHVLFTPTTILDPHASQ
jgi:hypothetical protein